MPISLVAKGAGLGRNDVAAAAIGLRALHRGHDIACTFRLLRAIGIPLVLEDPHECRSPP